MGVIDPSASAAMPVRAARRGLAFKHAFWENRSELFTTAGTVARPRKTLQDGELARRAIAGDGGAFAELYDRHERRVYGFCVRMLGTPHDAADATQETFVRMLKRLPAMRDRELNFAAYALACARNACYDMIEGRRRVEPVAEHSQPRDPQPGDVGEDPERGALLKATREEVRAANAKLPARQREVLALREIELLSYDDIGEIVGLKRNAVAQLISRARIKLREHLRGSALASVSASSPDCERALPLLTTLQDGEGAGAGELDWVRAHLAGCDTCRLSSAAMQEAGVSYRALAPLLPLSWLRHATIARAAEFVGVDWSDVASRTLEAKRPAEGQPPDGSPSRGHADGGQSGGPPALSGDRDPVGWRLSRWTLAAAVLVLCLVMLVMVGVTRDGQIQAHSQAPSLPVAHTTTAISSLRLHHRTVKTATAARLVTPSPPNASGTGATLRTALQAPHHSTHRAHARHRPHRTPAKHRPAAPVVTSPPPSATSTTPNPPTPTPPPTTTTPATQTAPAPAPPSTGSGESTGTTPTPGAPPTGPRGTFAP